MEPVPHRMSLPTTKSEDRKSYISMAPSYSPPPTQPLQTNNPQGGGAGAVYLKSPLDPFKHVSRLSESDLYVVCRAIGALSDDAEDPKLATIKSFWWPSHGLPAGLYQDVVRCRAACQWQYYLCSIFFTSSLILQLLLGSILTGISSSPTTPTVLITVLAAANTVVAGLLALMHNSGLPDRFKKDWNEYDYVEMYLHELMRSGVVKDGMTREQVVEYCYGLFKKAKGTVARNKPANYSSESSPPAQGGNGMGVGS